jgi:hypothetical protein
MKNRTFVSILILVLAVLIIAGSCTTGNKAYKKAFKEEVVGTWINTDYENNNYDAKVVIKPDGMYEGFHNAQDEDFGFGKITIIDRWTDSEGNIFYKAVVDIISWTNSYELWKLSKSGTVFEYVWSYTEYPTEINPNDTGYRILYRQ